jgi:uncharacterized RDD family membrane protein YckC
MSDSFHSEVFSDAVYQPMLYRCTCGQEFAVDPQWGGICPSCDQRVDAHALRLSGSATLTLQNLDDEANRHDFASTGLELPAGTMLGHFRLDCVIGTGGMGAVYRALDTSLQRWVAVKVIRSGEAITDEQVVSMVREAVAQARLNHPGIVTIYYIGRHGDEPFFAMEYVEGPTLADTIKEGHIEYGRAIRIALQVVEALSHANHFGIVHADIKPSNLLIDRDEHIKLSDFGLARFVTKDKQERPIAGTPSYLAPELVDGSTVTIQSDMYALGVALFEMVFGRLPFQLSGSSLREQLKSHHTSQIEFPTPWPKEVPREIAAIILRLLAKSPEDRYGEYDELKQDLLKVQPLETTIAGFAARGMAYAIDQIVIMLCLAPSAGIIWYLEGLNAGYRAFVPIIALISVVIPMFYLRLMGQGVSTFGRYLLQLRVCEKNGLPPGRVQLVTREFLRSMVGFLLPLGAYFSLYYPPILGMTARFLAIAMVIELTCWLVTPHRRTFHDLLCRSRVVLKFDTPSKDSA